MNRSYSSRQASSTPARGTSLTWDEPHLKTGDLKAAALELAARGIPVFPCLPGAKRPATQGGFHAASTDAATIGSWWSAAPMANIGVPTGELSGWDVLDIDIHGSTNGFAAFEQLQAAGLVPQWRQAVNTPSGGLHLYFPANRSNRCWASATGIDLRAAGGYVIVPPSRVRSDGGALRGYRLVAVRQGPCGMVDGAAIRARLCPRSPTGSAHRAAPARQIGPGDARRLARWVANRPVGTRNASLFWAVCRVAGEGVDAAGLRLLRDAALDVGLSEREIEATIRSAIRTVARDGTGLGPVVVRQDPWGRRTARGS